MPNYTIPINGVNFEFVYYNSASNLQPSYYYLPISVKYIPSTDTIHLTDSRHHITLCMPDILNEINKIIKDNLAFYNQFDTLNMMVFQPVETTYTPPNSYDTYIISSKINVGMRCL